MIHVPEQPVRIAFVNQPWNRFQSPVQSGSIAIWTDQVTQRLARKYAVTTYARKTRPLTPEPSRSSCIRSRFFDVRSDLRVLRGMQALPVERLGRLPLFASYWFYGVFALKVAADLRRTRSELVHVHNLSQFVPYIRRLNPHIIIVLHMHCEWLSQLNARQMARRIRQCNLLLGCSNYIASRIRLRFPDSPVPVKALHNGVATKVFKPRKNAPAGSIHGPKRVLFVGRVSPEKGVHLLIEAFIRIAPDHPELNLQIVGPYQATHPEFLVNLSDDANVTRLQAFYNGDYLTYLRQLVPEKLASRIEFCGRVDHHRLAAYYQDADFLVNPSLSESFGMSLIEAMACGLPVIASRVGGMPEIVREKRTGLLISPGDLESLAAAMDWILIHHQERRDMAGAARRIAAQQFAWEGIARQLDRLYQTLLAAEK